MFSVYMYTQILFPVLANNKKKLEEPRFRVLIGSHYATKSRTWDLEYLNVGFLNAAFEYTNIMKIEIALGE